MKRGSPGFDPRSGLSFLFLYPLIERQGRFKYSWLMLNMDLMVQVQLFQRNRAEGHRREVGKVRKKIKLRTL